MLRSTLFLLIDIVLIITLIYIFGLNLIMKTTKKVGEIIIICLLVPTIFAMSYFGYKEYSTSKRYESDNTYLGYKYLKVGDSTEAEKSAEEVLDKDSSNLNALQLKVAAKMIKGDFIDAKVLIKEYEIKNNPNDSIRDKLFELKFLSKLGEGALNSGDIKSYELKLGKKLPKRIKKYEGLKNKTAKDYKMKERYVKNQVEEIIDDTAQDLDLGKRRNTLDTVFEVKENINNDSDVSLVKEKVERLAEKNPNDLDIKKLQAMVEVKSGDITKAKEIAKEIVNSEDTIENKAALSDIYAQQARKVISATDSSKYQEPNLYQSLDINTGDKEIKSIQEKINKKALDIDDINKDYEGEVSKTELKEKEKELSEVKLKIADLNKDIVYLPIKRAINYLIASKPLNGEKLTPYYLELSKLYFAMDNRDKSRGYMRDAIEKGIITEEDPAVKDSFSDIKTALESGNQKFDEAKVSKSAEKIVNTMNNGITPIQKDSLSEEYKNFVVSTVKYSSANISIRRIRKSDYPHITANVNMGIDNENFFGFKTDFKASDIDVQDTGDHINKFSLERNNNKAVDVCLIFDKSPSMEGRPLEDSKLAGVQFIKNISKKQKLSVVSFNLKSFLECDSTDDESVLEAAISSMNTKNGDGTNISQGLYKAAKVLKDSDNNRAVILLTDGQDNDPSKIDAAIAKYKEEGIPVYAVGFGDVDDKFLGRLADETNGKFFKATNSTELQDIYELIQKEIENDYILKYKVESNQELNQRSLQVKMKDMDGLDLKDYSLGHKGDTDDSSDEDVSKFSSNKEFILSGIVNASVSKDDMGKDIYIDIKGENFKGNIQVEFGKDYSPDVKVINSRLLRAKLPSKMQEGVYDVTAINYQNKVSVLKNSFYVYIPGVSKTIKVGDITVKANSINKVDESNYIATGSVIVNNFLRTSGDLIINAYNVSSDKEGNISATSGEIKGDCKLYVSFKNNKNSFAKKVFGDKDLIAHNGSFDVNANSEDNDIKSEESGVLNLYFLKCEGPSLKLKPDSLQLTLFNISMTDAVADLKFFPIEEGNLQFNLNSEDLYAKAKIKVNLHPTVGGLNEMFDLPALKKLGAGLQLADKAKLSIEIDTKEGKYEFTGELGIPQMKAVGLQSVEGTLGFSAKNILLLDKIKFKLSLDDARQIPIPPSCMFYINAFGGGAENLSCVFDDNCNIDWSKAWNIMIMGNADISAGKKITLPVLGDIAIMEFTDLTLKSRLNLSRIEMSGKAKVLGNEMASLEITMDNEEGFKAKMSGGLELDIPKIISMALKGEHKLSITGDGLDYESSGKIKYDVIGVPEFEGNASSKMTVNSNYIIMKIKGSGQVNNNDNQYSAGGGVEVVLDISGNVINFVRKSKIVTF